MTTHTVTYSVMGEGASFAEALRFCMLYDVTCWRNGIEYRPVECSLGWTLERVSEVVL
jgi:hypothetical protein